MSQGIVPPSHKARLALFILLKAQLALNAATLNLTPAFLTGVNAMLDELIGKYQVLVDAEQAATDASKGAAAAYTAHDAALHGLFNTLKTNPNFTAEMGSAMGLAPTTSTHTAAQIKPTIELKAEIGHVRISANKHYAQMLNIYMRLVGTTLWILVAQNRKTFPFNDTTPLKVAGVPETREYQARGVINDVEVGDPSEIATVTFGG